MGAIKEAESEAPQRPRKTRRQRVLPWAVLGLWIAVLAVLVPFAGKLGNATRDTPADYLPDSADSTQVVRLLEALPGGGTTDLILVYERSGGLTAADKELAAQHAAEVDAAYDLTSGTPRAVPSKDGTTVMYPVAIGGLPDEDAESDAVTAVRDLVADQPEGLTAQVGGSGGLQYDSETVFDSVEGTLMMATAGIVAILLIITYRSPFLWLLPLVCVGVSAVIAMAAVYGVVQGFDLVVTSMSSSVMTVLIFGAGTDYALLLVARYREELRRNPVPYDAMLTALRGCGPAVLASSGTVAAGLLCLLAADLNSSSGLGPVGAIGVLCALAAMMTLLPALLVLLGRRVFWPLIPVYGSETKDGRGLFAKMGNSVSRRPVAVLGTGVVLLGVLALGVFNMPGVLKQEDTFTNTPESVTAMEIIAESYPEQSSQPITVLARDESAVTAIRDVSGVASAEAGRSGGGWTEILVFAKDPPESAGEIRTIETLRSELGAEGLVGGPSAEAHDMETTNADDRMIVIPLTLAAVLIILMLLLRSIVAPLVLTAAVVASWGAAMGLGGLVFGPVFDFPGIDPALPLLTFVFSVALGVDYGIFLMHRMREEALAGADTRTAALAALRKTGGVITSAGIVLAATFAVLATMPMVMMVEMGFIIAVGVLLDTFLVRTYLVTSASWLLDRAVWWPGALSRRPVPERDSPQPAAEVPVTADSLS